MNLHRLAEERSLALHRAIASRLRDQPELVDHARERVQRWLEDGSVAEPYARAWAGLLAQPLDELVAVLVDPSQRARALRQVTPFAGVIDPRTRWRIWRETRARVLSA